MKRSESKDFPFLAEDRHLRTEKNKARELRKSQWWKRQLAKGICHYCGQATRAEDLTMDHRLPLSRGGRSSRGNVVAACKSCNTRKNSLSPLEWEAFLARQAASPLDDEGHTP